MQYNEITPENVASFHFHGDMSTFPITAVIAVPNDKKSNALLQGRYVSDDEDAQMVRPAVVMEELLGTIFTVGRYVTFAVLIVGLSTLATMALVFLLSLQLRRRELETMIKIGASRWRVVCILGAEIFGVLCLGDHIRRVVGSGYILVCRIGNTFANSDDLIVRSKGDSRAFHRAWNGCSGFRFSLGWMQLEQHRGRASVRHGNRDRVHGELSAEVLCRSNWWRTR